MRCEAPTAMNTGPASISGFAPLSMLRSRLSKIFSSHACLSALSLGERSSKISPAIVIASWQQLVGLASNSRRYAMSDFPRLRKAEAKHRTDRSDGLP
jgi:hypothetical protein